MRILVLSALALATASCAWPPAELAAPAPASAPIALVAPSPPAAVAPAPPPPQAAEVAPAAVPFAPFTGFFGGPPPGRLTLSNFTYDNAHVEAVVTTAPDCGLPAGAMASNFVLPLNGTRVIESPPGADVCWRRAVDARSAPGEAPSPPGWTGWNRAFLSSGRSIDSQL